MARVRKEKAATKRNASPSERPAQRRIEGISTPPGVFACLAAVSAHAQLTILAPGLLGGSVARAARARGVAQRIVLWTRRPETRLKLREQPWCDAVADTPEDAARGAS